MAGLKAPEEFHIDGQNANQKWSILRKQYEFYECATELDAKKSKIQVATLLTCIEAAGRKVYEASGHRESIDYVYNVCNPTNKHTI